MTGNLTLQTQSAGQTKNLGIRLGQSLTPGTVVGLEGPLGAGKTTLIQGVCQGLGVKEKVISPTFVLMHVYAGRIPVYHFDLYRLEENQIDDLGWEEYLEGSGVSLIEWADRAKNRFQLGHLRIQIRVGQNADLREFTFQEHEIRFPWLKSLSLEPS